MRELTDTGFETPGQPRTKRQAPSLDDFCLEADKKGIGNQFRAFRKAAERHGLHPRTYQNSVMYSPPNGKTRMLFTVWVKSKDGKVSAYVSPPVFAELFPVREEIAFAELGTTDGWRYMTNDDVQAFVDGLDRLFKTIEANPQSE